MGFQGRNSGKNCTKKGSYVMDHLFGSRSMGRLTWPEIDELNKINSLLIIPVGATEQHGHHLPLDTDTRIVFEIVKQSVDKLPEHVNALYTPAVWFGYSEHHRGFAGLMSVKGDTLVRLMFDLCSSAYKEGFHKILLLNGHGGNVLYLSAACRALYDDLGVKVGLITYWDLITDDIAGHRDSPLGGINHACELETSLMLHIEASLVKTDKIQDNVMKKGKYNRADLLEPGILFTGGSFKEISTSGVVGMPSAASRTKGEILFKAAVKKVQEFIMDYMGS